MAIRPSLVDELRDDLHPTTRALWLAFMTSTAVITGVGVFIVTSGPNARPLHPLAVGLFLAFASLALAAAVAVHGRLVTLNRLVPARGERARLRLGALEVEPGPETVLVVGARRYRAALVLAWALAEAAAVIGFFLTLLSSEPAYAMAVGGLVILVDLLVLRPRSDTYAALARYVDARGRGVQATSSAGRASAR